MHHLQNIKVKWVAEIAKCGEITNWGRNHQLLNKDPVPRI
jgi:hypothetical protein